mmetsp:Transcript_15002/g.36887  ORF Transcript_15002/g.36887 Transcript_15002/m.36887 type:complete len:217 (-) Transcript_15002:1009-1659(-)
MGQSGRPDLGLCLRLSEHLDSSNPQTLTVRIPRVLYSLWVISHVFSTLQHLQPHVEVTLDRARAVRLENHLAVYLHRTPLILGRSGVGHLEVHHVLSFPHRLGDGIGTHRLASVGVPLPHAGVGVVRQRAVLRAGGRGKPLGGGEALDEQAVGRGAACGCKDAGGAVVKRREVVHRVTWVRQPGRVGLAPGFPRGPSMPARPVAVRPRSALRTADD